MSQMRDIIENQMAAYDRLGLRSPMHQLILNKGRDGKAAKLPRGIWRGPSKACFENSAKLVLKMPELTYVEGYATNGVLAGYPFHHAWAEDRDGNVIDATWENPEEAGYFGVPFTAHELSRELVLTGYYSLLYPNDMMNVKLAFRLDPSLEDMLPRTRRRA